MSDFNDMETPQVDDDIKEGAGHIKDAALDAVRHNWVGVALTVVRHRTSILITIAVLLMIPFIVFVAIPTALFEKSVSNPEVSWDEDYEETAEKTADYLTEGYHKFRTEAQKKGEAIKAGYGDAGSGIEVEVYPEEDSLEISNVMVNRMMATFYVLEFNKTQEELEKELENEEKKADNADEQDDDTEEAPVLEGIYNTLYYNKVKAAANQTAAKNNLFTIKKIDKNVYEQVTEDSDGNKTTTYTGTIVVNVDYRPEMFLRSEINDLIKSKGGEVDDAIAIELEDATPTQLKLVEACAETAWPGAGLCATWVSMAYANAGYAGYGGNANDQWANYCYTDDRKELAPGMMIAVQHSGADYESWTYGHVGIYIGNDQVMHSVSNGVVVCTVDEWIASFDPYNTVKWGYPDEIKKLIEEESGMDADYHVISDVKHTEDNRIAEEVYEEIDDVTDYLDSEFKYLFSPRYQMKAAASYVDQAKAWTGTDKKDILNLFKSKTHKKPDKNWDCEFVVACGYAAGLQRSEPIIPDETSTDELYKKLQDNGQILKTDSRPKAGYLIFLKGKSSSEKKGKTTGTALRVGIVTEFNKKKGLVHAAMVTEKDEVSIIAYKLADPAIYGYGVPTFPKSSAGSYVKTGTVTGKGNSLAEVAENEYKRANAAGEVGGKVYRSWDQNTWDWLEMTGTTPNWCACFVSWCGEQLGYCTAGYFPRTWSVYAYTDFFREHGGYGEVHNKDGYKPVAGDLAIYDWNCAGTEDHIEIVINCTSDGAMTSIGGNSGNAQVPPGGRFCDYSQVAQHTYGFQDGVIWGYIHPYYDKFK